MTQQTIIQLNPASKSKTAMLIDELLTLSETAGVELTAAEYDKLHQAFFNIETKMLKSKKLVRLYPIWEVSELSHGR